MELSSTKQLEQLIKNATVKIFVDGKFCGTGFFFCAQGYVLSAFHCISKYSTVIVIETPHDGTYSAQIDKEKSLIAKKYDIAVLRVAYKPSTYLPLGMATETMVSDAVTTIGYPASHLSHNEKVGVYKGYISRWREDNRLELSDAIKGKGHSGSAVYHHDSERVIAIVVEKYLHGTMVDTGRVVRLEGLFQKWPELASLNQQSITNWSTRLSHLLQSDVTYLIFSLHVPHSATDTTIAQGIRQLVEEKWFVKLLDPRKNILESTHFENVSACVKHSHVVLLDISNADPDVMFALGLAIAQGLPMLLFASNGANIPNTLLGHSVIRYDFQEDELDVDELESQILMQPAIQDHLQAPRTRYLSVHALKKLTGLPISYASWINIQRALPTNTDWENVNETQLAALLRSDSDMALLLKKRVLKRVQ